MYSYEIALCASIYAMYVSLYQVVKQRHSDFF